MIDAGIIGAGPAGSLAAKQIASKGYNVHVYEEHNKVGKPNHCAGMVSVEGLKLLGVDRDSSFIQNSVYGGVIYSNEGESIKVRDRKPRAFIIDRTIFDEELANQARDKGAFYHLSSRVEKLTLSDVGKNLLGLKDFIVVSKLLIDAEGAGGRLLRRSGIDTGQQGLLTGFNVEVEGVEMDPEIVELWFDHKKFHGFFAWAIPLGDRKVRCGLATSRNDGAKQLQMFIKSRFGVPKLQTFRSGLVCSGGPIEKTVYDGLMIVGDAAGQAKPTTGGGVVLGGMCGVIAGKKAVESLTSEDYSSGKLKEYEKAWRESYGWEFRTMLALRLMMNRLNNSLISKTLRSFKGHGLEDNLQKLVEEGDMDMQSGVIKSALTDPRILLVLLRSIGNVALEELLSIFKL
jgi:digeranylgeranylglycerophospholipid reductase